jgi:PTH1 family peptidyl-tRNA hydrolase
MAVRALAERLGAPAPEARWQGLFSRCVVGQSRLGLLAPTTFMNRSGESVRLAFQAHPELSAERLLVVHDDLDLPLGRLRLRASGGAGGQRGLADVLEALGTREVPRLRVGVGRPPEGVAARDWVLSDFADSESGPLGETVGRAVEAMQAWVSKGLERAMEEFNRAPIEATPPESG